MNGLLRLGPGALRGEVAVPPSKSLLHRGMVCAALAGEPAACRVPDAPSEDVAATRRCLAALLAPEDAGVPARVDCGESGTTLRLLVPVAAALGREAVFEGRGRLPLRPMKPYADCFAGSGAVLRFPEDPATFLPLSVSGRLRPGVFALPGDVSSQFVSGLLLALPLLGGPSEIRLLSPLQSRPYVDMTLAVMRAFGVEAPETPRGFAVAGSGRYRAPAAPYEAEGDASQAAFWHLANFLGSRVSVANDGSSLQGDSAFPALLARLAAAPAGGPPPRIDVSQVPDLVPALAAAAAFSPAGARLVHAERLRLKESDRLATTRALLRAFGCAAEETADGLAVPPGPPNAPAAIPVVDGAGDHRIVMAAAMLATRAPCLLRGAGAVAKSYPSFFDDYRRAGGRAAAASPD
ncbi:MAG: 3-phosphoshikimate 1-carboxyvinyltransferase [Kiritimatiellae bacterium]|nr:3-phosphoshikimate 1-carboxyvinyltransferase [Kiritimatiellia bacterium]